MPIALIFDTETTGKPPKMKARKNLIPANAKHWPHMTQLCAKLVEFGDGMEPTPVGSMNLYCKLDGVEVPDEPFFVEQGLTTARVNRWGVIPKVALTSLYHMAASATITAGHNLAFDLSVIYMASVREGREDAFQIFQHRPQICTMKTLTNVLRLPSPWKRGEFKWPTLMESYKALVDAEGFESAHDAFADVNATEKVFFACVKKGYTMEELSL